MPGSIVDLADYFADLHRGCDACWAELEAAAQQDDTPAVRAAWQAFERAMFRHLGMEEEILFPAFEAATGQHDGGPTHVMREEHGRMRAVLGQMQEASERSDSAELLDLGDTLLLLVQQHNVKEEGALYPMAERALGGQWDELRARLDSYP